MKTFQFYKHLSQSDQAQSGQGQSGQVPTGVTAQILFQGEFDETQMNDSDLIKLVPYGMQISTDGVSPILLLKEEKGEATMPVPLNHLEAGVAITQSNKQAPPVTPHKLTQLLFESLNIQIQSCVFTEIKGPHQYVHLNFIGHPALTFLKVRADEAMSLCLHLNVPFFATAAFIAKSRVLIAEIEGVQRGLNANPGILVNPQKYIM
ncbi:MAG: hypothetical protein BroJett041_23660 [Candidatus Jettenia caeni]|nr:MAG: hypothetical protein BroJett041_23660 [Candidatus Jettenia caeni]